MNFNKIIAQMFPNWVEVETHIKKATIVGAYATYKIKPEWVILYSDRLNKYKFILRGEWHERFPHMPDYIRSRIKTLKYQVDKENLEKSFIEQ